MSESKTDKVIKIGTQVAAAVGLFDRIRNWWSARGERLAEEAAQRKYAKKVARAATRAAEIAKAQASLVESFAKIAIEAAKLEASLQRGQENYDRIMKQWGAPPPEPGQ